jgi:hypothetical protein
MMAFTVPHALSAFNCSTSHTVDDLTIFACLSGGSTLAGLPLGNSVQSLLNATNGLLQPATGNLLNITGLLSGGDAPPSIAEVLFDCKASLLQSLVTMDDPHHFLLRIFSRLVCG